MKIVVVSISKFVISSSSRSNIEKEKKKLTKKNVLCDRFN